MLAAEVDFYSAYDWCLDPHLVVSEAIEHLAAEIAHLQNVQLEWQAHEVATNVFLLACSLLNGTDEYLRGHTLRMPRQLARTRPGQLALWAADKVASLPKRNWTQIRHWNEELQLALDAFFAALAHADPLPPVVGKLSALLQCQLPSSLHTLRLGVPSAFSRLDLTFTDVLELGRQFMQLYPNPSHPVLLLGLRTAGTYFSALLHSFFRSEGYQQVAALTVQPRKGPGWWERRELARYAKQGFTLVIVDDPPNSGDTVTLAVGFARQAGFDQQQIKVLVPTHRATPGWASVLPEGLVVTLEPERWQKEGQLLDAGRVESRLASYYALQGFSEVRVVGSPQTPKFNLLHGSNLKLRGTTLERIFEVQLGSPRGSCETRYVLAKGVGLGYLGYPAFLAAHQLSDFVPPVLGLRDGILYTEWLHQQSSDGVGLDRTSWIDTTAAYIARRTCRLNLPKCRQAGKAVSENGLELLAEALARAYSRIGLNIPMRSWIQQQLYRLQCPFPTLIDGNMGRSEWIGRSGRLKVGYYEHGLGKTQLNAIDPAYDLAETILSFELSSEEEDQLIRRYVEHSGDATIGQRLFFNKLLAGLWTMVSAQEMLFDTIQSGKQEQHQRFLGAWDFLTIQTARLCGAYCRRPGPWSWRSPVIMLDIDGVMDRRIFGFPSTTAAGIEALSALAAHDCSVALNTARSVQEVKGYCEAYGLAGGVAEHGAYLWDALARCGRPLIDQDTRIQLDALRKELRRIPGIFLDERHQYSIRAYMIETKPRNLFLRMRAFSIGQGVPIPLPTLLVNHLITTLGLDRLSFHQTTIDTAVIAKGVDKGTGLIALRDQVLGSDAEVIAIGDTEADLPMFRAATRSFAPANISCRQEAQLLGCTVSRHRYQRGLLDAVRGVVGCAEPTDRIQKMGESEGERLFLDLLRAADHIQGRVLVRAFLDGATFKIFLY